jgi:hypothetical protein
MVIPLTDAGAVKATLACPLPGVTVPMVGALGTVAVSAETALTALTKIKATPIDLNCFRALCRAKFIDRPFVGSKK